MTLKDSRHLRYLQHITATFLPAEFKEAFKWHLAAINFQRSRNLALLLFVVNIALIISDFIIFQSGMWAIKPEYKLLYQAHAASTVIMLLLVLLSAVLTAKPNLRWQSGFALLTASCIYLYAVIVSGGIDQLIHQQISVYILVVFTISSFIYYRPLVSFLLCFGFYILFVGLLWRFQPDYNILRGHIINGSLAALVAWVFSVNLFRLHARDFWRQKSLEEIVAQQKEMYEEMKNRNREKLNHLAAIVESTDDGIIGMSTDGTVFYWNQGAEQVYGYTEKEMVGNSIRTIFVEDQYDELDQIFEGVLNGEKISHLETERRHKNGRIVEVSLTVSPIIDETDKIIGISTIVRDISSHKRMERELDRLDRLNLIGEMAASISHEVRNPMTTVRGFMQLLYDKEENKNNRSYFDLMIEELDRANSILTEFLSISRTKVTERRSQNLNVIVNSMLPLLEANAVSNNQSIHTELMEIPDLMLDDKETRQVILNLSRNGIEAMAKGGILTIRTCRENDEVVLEIQDQGPGISPELLERLGTPFLTTKNEGTGLGLAICYGIAARHDARIEVETGENGTTFRVRFKR
jgi:PAS domain S-box-containing protein